MPLFDIASVATTTKGVDAIICSTVVVGDNSSLVQFPLDGSHSLKNSLGKSSESPHTHTFNFFVLILPKTLKTQIQKMATRWEEAFDPFFVQRVVVSILVLFAVFALSKPLWFVARFVGYALLAIWIVVAVACTGYTLVHTGALLFLTRSIAQHFVLTENAMWQKLMSYL